MGNILIKGSAAGGDGIYSGSILTIGTGPANIGNVTILGELVGRATTHGVISQGSLGAVTIKGALRGELTTTSVIISALGGIDAPTAALAGGIKSLAVGGNVINAQIRSGYNSGGSALNADASIGAVRVGGDWIASSIIAGATFGLNVGDADDAKIAEAVVDGIRSQIASIAIKGYVAGNSAVFADHFGFVAERIGSLKVGTVIYPLVSGPSSTLDLAGYAVGATGDVRVREV